MGNQFVTQVYLSNYSENKVKTLITNLYNLKFVLQGLTIGYCFESLGRYNQTLQIYAVEDIIHKIQKGFASESSLFIDQTKIIKFGAQFQDTGMHIKLYLDTETNRLELVFWHNDWKRDFEKPIERYRYDNGRYARLVLEVIEPFILQDFKIKDDYEYLDEELTQNCLASATRFVGPDFAQDVINNILFNKYFITLTPENPTLPIIDHIKKYVLNQDIPHLYIRNKTTCIARLEIHWQKSQVFLFPLAPYYMKIFHDEQGIDLQFYLRLLLNICNHYPIWELRTNFC